ncbi:MULTISPECIES: FAD-binding oxidoreductase [Aneurinibacillus]|uniref:FAD-binding protein n=1 Tax=Aneurinibacillus thermoaerophilus TaxID=143495 RepID=A0ABX8YFX2_ANETH|nr:MULTISPECIES: FAD-linked oxidase C-terminal domain-containing protein [Aneurinibacillus]MED0678808.1 FAD-linked oxidase C-terminal domain-containing protein [Aneurinibacillus thermoaerophilus]MED0736681.1 FAD-linked oxidase C-terminal domain-containing protein [Aneurinibacillus thermoaerophilus]MED0758336.1 FAD-linked oxidase C-terminal domain-containing protein [Aneurinibacillus thermoaerophilus]MED0759857.1 FAD-linked oxidase C-terminal domain-containing protein [Aneurinibacillus thermoaer
MKPEDIEEVKKIVKMGRVLTDESDLFSYSFDASFGTYLPDLVVQTKSVTELAALVKLANRKRIPVYPRGQSTCLSGGPLPVKGGMVFDLSVMNDVLEIDEEDLIAVVSPGVLTADIHRAAEKKGLMYPPDPSSSHVSTIGGNLAENSGGPRGLKYGVTKDYVIGLEVIVPEGEIIRTGGRTVKNVTGYDLTKLIVGSEGTLGIITKAILRLLPKPPASETVMAVFDSLVDAGGAISKILSSGILPAKMELMDQASIIAVENYEPSNLPVDAEAIILLELDGHPVAVKDEVQQVAELCKAVGAREIRIPGNEAEKAEIWRARKLVSPAIVRIKPTKISEDATVPRSKIPDMCARLQEIRRKYNIHLVVFGHAGDGNLHPNIIADKNDKEEMKRVEEAIAEIFAAAVELGGTLSGEHGIGTMKAPFMEMELGAVGLDMMRRIKQVWDPNNIMNPGKIFPEPGQKLELT